MVALAADVKAGETLLVNGATGSFGSAAVAIALAMGAGCVVATGRNDKSLGELVRRYGPRVRTVQLRGNEQDDRIRMSKAAPGPIDCVLDLPPPVASATWVRAALMTVRQNGRVVLMGGVGMLDGGGLDLSYPWIMRNCITIHGQWMYPREATTRMVGLIRAGLVNLDQYDVTTFGLHEVYEAVTHCRQRWSLQQDSTQAVIGKATHRRPKAVLKGASLAAWCEPLCAAYQLEHFGRSFLMFLRE